MRLSTVPNRGMAHASAHSIVPWVVPTDVRAGLPSTGESADQDEAAPAIAGQYVAMGDSTTVGEFYEIRIRGELSDALIDALGASRPSKSATTIVVRAEDKAALHSAIRRIEDLALELISVTPVSSQGDA